jgi:lipoate-protein ligase A
MEKWYLLKDMDSLEPSVNMAVEEIVAQEVGNGELPLLRLWKNEQPSFVLGKLTHTNLNLSHPIWGVIQRGKIALVKRFSGGEAIFQNGGCLNFSVTVPSNHPFAFNRIGKTFKTLSSGMIRALNNLGVCAQYGKVEGVFCPGPYDIVVGRRKLAGVSLAKRSRFTLVHGTLLVNVDLDEYVEIVEKFYHGLGKDKKLRKDKITSLSKEMGRNITLDELIGHILRGYREVFGIQFAGKSLSSLQRYQAEKLSCNYRVQFF